MKKLGVWQIAAALMVGASAQAMMAQGGAKLNEVLAKMDAASKSFKDAQADFSWDYYQKIVNDTSTDKGTIYFEREGGTTDVGAMLSGGPGGKPKQVIAYTGSELQVYTPSENQLQVFQAGASGSDYQGFLTLGFGGSGTALESKWTVTDMGPETLTINGSPVQTEKLNLVPKDPGMAKTFKNVVMWVDLVRGIGVKQIFYTTTGGNYRTTTYSNIRLNGHVDKGKYGITVDNKVKTDKGTQVFRH